MNSSDDEANPPPNSGWLAKLLQRKRPATSSHLDTPSSSTNLDTPSSSTKRRRVRIESSSSEEDGVEEAVRMTVADRGNADHKEELDAEAQAKLLRELATKPLHPSGEMERTRVPIKYVQIASLPEPCRKETSVNTERDWLRQNVFAALTHEDIATAAILSKGWTVELNQCVIAEPQPFDPVHALGTLAYATEFYKFQYAATQLHFYAYAVLEAETIAFYGAYYANIAELFEKITKAWNMYHAWAVENKAHAFVKNATVKMAYAEDDVWEAFSPRTRGMIADLTAHIPSYTGCWRRNYVDDNNSDGDNDKSDVEDTGSESLSSVEEEVVPIVKVSKPTKVPRKYNRKPCSLSPRTQNLIEETIDEVLKKYSGLLDVDMSQEQPEYVAKQVVDSIVQSLE